MIKRIIGMLIIILMGIIVRDQYRLADGSDDAYVGEIMDDLDTMLE